MRLLDRLTDTSLTRVVTDRVAAAAYPPFYSMRARVPRYNLQAQATTFALRAAERGLGDVKLYYWYHTIDLGGGLVTPGVHDYRRSVADFHFPGDMTGLSVLDVGSATGFFAFEFERRGADVVSVEVPSLDGIDRFPYQDANHTVTHFAEMTAGESAYASADFESIFHRASAADFYHYVIDGPFQLCHRALQSKVERHYSTIYDLSAGELARRRFDLVFLGDLLLHTLHPLNALAAVAPLCAGTLVISQDMPAGLGSQPAVRYVGGDALGTDDATWWYPNRACFEQLLRKLGFSHVDVVGRNTGASRPSGTYYDRPVLHAVR